MVTRLLQLRRGPRPARRRRRARARAVPLVAGAAARPRGATGATRRPTRLDDAIAAASPRPRSRRSAPMIGSVRGTVIERTATGEVLVEVGGVGYRALVPAGALPRARTRATPRSCSRTSTCAKTRWCSTASRRATSATRSRRSSAPPASGPKLALAMLSVHSPTRAAARAARRRPRRAHAGARGRQAHRAAAARRAEGPPRVPDLDLTEAGGAPAPRAEVRAALAGLGYAPDEVRDVVGAAARGRARSRTSCARRSSSWR